MIEELHENLLKVKENDLDLEEYTEPSPNKMSPNKVPNQSLENGAEFLNYLSRLRKGNGIIGSKEFNLVFYITCFVPFIRPNIPIVRDSSINQAKHQQREGIKKRRHIQAIKEEEVDAYDVDMQVLDFLRK